MKLPRPAGVPAFTDLNRPPLSERSLAARVVLVAPWRSLHVLPVTTSTNDVVATAARAGEPEGLVVVAESQSAGRGRLDRQWVSPPRAGLTFSMLLRPPVDPVVRPWVPLLLAAAAADALSAHCGLDVKVKWPNDLLVGGRKVGGMLSESTGDAIIVGLGINVSTTRDELPREDATSLALETGAPVDRGPALLALLREMGPAYTVWLAGGATAASAAERYRQVCDTLGREVVAALPGGAELHGVATAINDDGSLAITEPNGRTTSVSAGDILHLHPA